MHILLQIQAVQIPICVKKQGLTNWETSTTANIIADNRNHALAIQHPFQLTSSRIRGDTDSNAIICVNLAQVSLTKIIHQASKKIEEHIFETLCPNYVNNSSAAIQLITQVKTNPEYPASIIVRPMTVYYFITMELCKWWKK